MKKLLLTLVLLIAIQGLWAQDFAPSQQAQGYLDSKNITVDYATGLFHYSVPLYVLKTGDFELPISLNYVGKGVKVDDLPGLVGYNWSLNTGGVVTRTIRGGIADEEYPKGYIHRNLNYLSIEEVNKRKIDGESDIFTAIFGGQSVNFIIKREGDKIVAESLERTNVRIECEHSGSLDYYPIINGWKITDENGNKFYFRQKEWSSDIVNEGAISFNGVRGVSYISSWHINRIEPRNYDPIVYNYRANVNEGGNDPQNINEVNYSSSYNSFYIYGSPMFSRSFDFGKYSDEYNSYMYQAHQHMKMLSWDLELSASESTLASWVGFFQNPSLDIIHQYMDVNFRVMGMMADLRHIGSASSNVTSTLSAVISVYENIGGLDAKMAASYLSSAKDVIYRCLTEAEPINYQSTSGGSSLKMKSPLLENIICNDKTIKFNYQDDGTPLGHKLKTINVENVARDEVLKINFKYYESISQLSFCDRKNVEFNRIKFDYYRIDSLDYIADVWGFYKKNEPIADYQFYTNADPRYSKLKSLSKIVSSDRGEISLDYEPNNTSIRLFSEDFTIPFGGLRIKSLVFKEPVSNTIDTIKYIYPYPGEMVYSESYNWETVYYSGFEDQIRHSRFKNFGSTFLNLGNNGVYYDYVEEEFAGMKKAYLFFNPLRYGKPTESPYKFWLNALPLGVATYDKNGNLKSLVKNHYWADIDPIDRFKYNSSIMDIYAKNWFTRSDNSTVYYRSKYQIKAYEYYMDYEYLKTYFQNQPNALIYKDGPIEFYVNPYNDIFLPNIAPRTSVQLPVQWWELFYGGRVLLKSQEEYRVEGNYSTASSINHFVATDLGTPFNKVEYFYDNLPHSTAPTRISTTDSRGDTYASVIRRVIDMDESAIGMEVISAMKSQNILSPIIKQQTLKNGTLLKETVNIYSPRSVDGITYFGAIEEKMYIPESSSLAPIINGKDNNLYTYPAANYSSEKTINYIFDSGKYVTASIADKSEIITSCYDFSLNVPIIEAKAYSNTYISATNSYIHNFEYSELAKNLTDIWYDKVTYTYGYMEHLEQQNLTGRFLELRDSEGFNKIKSLFEIIINKFPTIEYSELFEKYYFPISISNWKEEFLEFVWGGILYGYDAKILEETIYSIESTSEMYGYLKYKHLIDQDSSLSVSQFANSKLKLYIVSKSAAVPISYTVTHSGGTSTGSVNLSSKPYWNVQALDIDLSIYSGITSVKMNPPSSRNIAYLALVPADCEFEATSYNSDGTVFCKFNQNGQMERYEYDSAGRVIKVFDQNGNMLKENTYNFNLP